MLHYRFIFRYQIGSFLWLGGLKLSKQQDNKCYKFLFYGTHSVRGEWCNHEYREWIIQGIALEETKKFILPTPDGSVLHSEKCEPIQLHGFAGSELGATACFKIHDGFFYTLTNCDAFGVIEVDYTSYYHCIRFPVDDPQALTCQAARRIFRRQHADGPVNDSWHLLGRRAQ